MSQQPIVVGTTTTPASIDTNFGNTHANFGELYQEKQDVLVSGTSIKTINGTSLLGAGDIAIEGGTSADTFTGNYIEFISIAASFAPLISTTGSPVVLWTFDDGTTSNSLAPNKAYGTVARRVNKLTVTPWSGLVGINLGYNRLDGGPSSTNGIPMAVHPQTDVTEINNLGLCKGSLVFFCSEYGNMTTLNFNGFSALRDIELYGALLQTVHLHALPELRRCCFEDCNLASLDLSEMPLLEDLRGALNAFNNITYGGAKAHQWHICTRSNSGLTNTGLYNDMVGWGVIREFWIWNDNQYGTLSVPLSAPNLSLLAYDNHYSGLNLQGAMTSAGSSATVDMHGNSLTSVNITGCYGLTNLNLQNNLLSSLVVDSILAGLDALGRSNGTVTLNGTGNIGPSTAGTSSAQALIGKGWAVNLNAEVGAPDTQAPSVPTGLATVVNGTSISLSWNAATDNVAVSHYILRRDGTQVGGNITGLAYTDSGLTATTEYNYTIEAVDAASNASGQSGAVAATTGTAESGIVYVNSAQDYEYATTSNPQSVTLNLVVGNVVAVFVVQFNGSGPSLTDNLGNTYTLVPGSTVVQGPTTYWYTSVVQYGGSATITFDSTGTFQSLGAAQFSGVNTANPVGIIAEQHLNSGTTRTVGPLTTTAANEVVLFGAHHDAANITAAYTHTAGYTQLFGEGAIGSAVERPIMYQIYNTVQNNISVSLTCTGGSLWIGNAISLRAA